MRRHSKDHAKELKLIGLDIVIFFAATENNTRKPIGLRLRMYRRKCVHPYSRDLTFRCAPEASMSRTSLAAD